MNYDMPPPVAAVPLVEPETLFSESRSSWLSSASLLKELHKLRLFDYAKLQSLLPFLCSTPTILRFGKTPTPLPLPHTFHLIGNPQLFIHLFKNLFFFCDMLRRQDGAENEHLENKQELNISDFSLNFIKEASCLPNGNYFISLQVLNI